MASAEADSAAGTISADGLYTAPADLPAPANVTIVASSAAQPASTGHAEVTVTSDINVGISPTNTTSVELGAQQSFTTALATYTAPGTPPSPNLLQVVAISSDDTSQSGSANVIISTGANIQSLHPVSVYAGGADGFTIRVDGGGFHATTPGPGSTLLIGGSSRTTNCTTSAECTAPVFASDVASPGNVTVQLQNPDGTRSNTVELVVVPQNVTDASIALTSSASSAGGEDIVVVRAVHSWRLGSRRQRGSEYSCAWKYLDRNKYLHAGRQSHRADPASQRRGYCGLVRLPAGGPRYQHDLLRHRLR